jgi:15-cis-phytoene synthase
MDVIRTSEQLKALTGTHPPSQSMPIAESNVDESILATHGQTFHFASRFLAPKTRHDVVALYAFFRTLDDLVDVPEEGRSLEDVHTELDAWKRWFVGGALIPCASRTPWCNPFTCSIQALCSRYHLPGFSGWDDF